MALDQSGFGQELEMARDAGLRLAQDLGEIRHRQFGLRQQRKDPQARGLSRSPQRRVNKIEWQRVDHRLFQRLNAASLSENI
jgi:hypothetical protein